MKTTILTITPSDDIYSIQDKLSWHKSGRVLLILEGKNPLFQSRKELSLLLRSTRNTGSQIGVITESRAIRTAVKQYGIPVFQDQQEAMRKGWTAKGAGDRKIDEQKRLNNIKAIQEFEKAKKHEFSLPIRLSIFFVAVLAVLSLVLFFLPHARIQFTVTPVMQVSEIPLTGNTEISSTTMSGILPIYTKVLEYTLSDQIACSGNSEVPVTKASGHVLIQNLTDNEIEIPANTIFSSSTAGDIRFQSLESAVLPAGVNETIQLPVESLLPGENGNIEENVIDAVEGNIGLFVSVTNQEGFSGGESQVSSTPTDNDLHKLRAQIRTSLLEMVADDFADDAFTNEIFIPGSVRIVEILSEEMEPEIGQPSEILKLTQEVSVEGWFIQKSDIEQVLVTVLDSQIPQGMVPVHSELVFESTESPRINNEEVSWSFLAGREVIQNIDLEAIPNMLAGKTAQEAQALLISMGYSEDQFEIHTMPSWWNRMPFLENNIKVDIVE
jgi:hypothetical protein